ncbi:MAG: tRNA (adenosine(37)-N6)-dimethylallyltransferase MiaA, partial [Bacteroidetes bacterium]|nr:tRNA (adenosine(37)-N6)-dimethylallyltransferase MiaA [Bacteroidota bacterium]
KFKQHSRNYAKRQMTWLRRDKEIVWFQANEIQKMEEFIRSSLN